jgi:hypothetical protein
MKDNTRPPRFKGTERWKVIPSTVTDRQIQEYEKQIGLVLPGSGKYFLKYKNFIEMSLREYQVVFFKSLSTNWVGTLFDHTQYYREQLNGRGLIPFADYSNYGGICFDSNSLNGGVTRRAAA